LLQPLETQIDLHPMGEPSSLASSSSTPTIPTPSKDPASSQLRNVGSIEAEGAEQRRWEALR
jgi:hypothetical protein